MKRNITIFFVLLLVFSLFTTTALAELAGSKTVRSISGSGSFTMTVSGSSSWQRGTIRITSANSSSGNTISVIVKKGNTIYVSDFIFPNADNDFGLPALASKGTYTIQYTTTSSTDLTVTFNP